MIYIKNLSDKTEEELNSYQFPSNNDRKRYVFLINPSYAWTFGARPSGVFYYRDYAEPIK